MGSEMCIRDSPYYARARRALAADGETVANLQGGEAVHCVAGHDGGYYREVLKAVGKWRHSRTQAGTWNRRCIDEWMRVQGVAAWAAGRLMCPSAMQCSTQLRSMLPAIRASKRRARRAIPLAAARGV